METDSSILLLIADLHSQAHALRQENTTLQQENRELREALNDAGE